MMPINYILLPEITVLALMLVTAISAYFLPQTKYIYSQRIQQIVMIGLVAAALLTSAQNISSELLFGDLLLINLLSQYSKVILLLLAAVSFPLAGLLNLGMLPILMLLIELLCAMVAISSHNFIILYASIELMAFATMIIAFLENAETVVKQLFGHIITSCLILFGISIIYALTGAMDFATLNQIFYGQITCCAGRQLLFVIIGLTSIISALAYKMAVIPYHSWLATQASHMGYFSHYAINLMRIALSIVLAKLLYAVFIDYETAWSMPIIVSSLSCTLIGSIICIRQSNLKSIATYFGISNLGFILLALTTGNLEGVSVFMLSLIYYNFTYLGTLSIFAILSTKGVENLQQLPAVLPQHRLLSLLLSVFLLSLAGIPPLPGFFAKFYLLHALIKQDMYASAIICSLSAIINTCCCLNFLAKIYFHPVYNKQCRIVYYHPIIFMLMIIASLCLLQSIEPYSMMNVAQIIAKSIFDI